jgi:hypothetical protein
MIALMMGVMALIFVLYERGFTISLAEEVAIVVKIERLFSCKVNPLSTISTIHQITQEVELIQHFLLSLIISTSIPWALKKR